MSKGFVSDKMIEDIKKCIYLKDSQYDDDVYIIDKDDLKNLGYEVEKEKTALKEARELCDIYYNVMTNIDHHNCSDRLDQVKNLYEKAIEEQQEEIEELKNKKIDDDLIEWLQMIVDDNNSTTYGAYYNGEYFIYYAEKLLKQLGVNE